MTYDITNLVSPAGTDAVKLVVPNDPTEGFIAYRNDGNGDWRTDKMEFRVIAKYFLEDGSQVTFSKEKPGVFTHSSLNHNDICLEYVKDSSGKFVPINGSTVDRANYQTLKEQYEDETFDYSFSKRESTGQLELIITTRENDFPDLDEVLKAEYLDLVTQLDELDQEQADYYRKQLT